VNNNNQIHNLQHDNHRQDMVNLPILDMQQHLHHNIEHHKHQMLNSKDQNHNLHQVNSYQLEKIQ
jgi:hypothetical protein